MPFPGSVGISCTWIFPRQPQSIPCLLSGKRSGNFNGALSRIVSVPMLSQLLQLRNLGGKREEEEELAGLIK